MLVCINNSSTKEGGCQFGINNSSMKEGWC